MTLAKYEAKYEGIPSNSSRRKFLCYLANGTSASTRGEFGEVNHRAAKLSWRRAILISGQIFELEDRKVHLQQNFLRIK